MPNYVITGSTDATARVYNMLTGSVVNTLRTKSPVLNVAASQSGSFAIASTKFSTHIIDFKCEKTKELDYNHIESGISVDSITVTKNARYIVSGFSNGEISTYDLAEGKTIKKIKSKGDKVKYITTSIKNYIVAVYYDKSVRIYDIQQGTQIGNMMHNEHINTVTTSSNGYYVAAASQTGKVYLYWYQGSDRLFKVYDYHKNIPITAIAMSEDYIVSGDTNGNIILFSILSNNYILKMKMDTPVTSIAFSTDYKQIITSGFHNQATVWDIKTGQIKDKLDGHKKGSIITSVAVSDYLPDNNIDKCFLDYENIADLEEENVNKMVLDNDQLFKSEIMQDNHLIECFNECNIADYMPEKIDDTTLNDKYQDIKPFVDLIFGQDKKKSYDVITDDYSKGDHIFDIIYEKINKSKIEKLINAVFDNDNFNTIHEKEDMRHKALNELAKLINHRFSNKY